MKDFKMKCEWSKDRAFTTGKTYEYINGAVKCDTGTLIGEGFSNWNTVEDFNKWRGKSAHFVSTEPPQFTKADLKTGMRVELRDGTKLVVLLGTRNGDRLVKGPLWGSLDEYTNELIDENESENDIVKVFDMAFEYNLLNSEEHGKLLWQRPTPKHYTISEAKAKLSEIDGQPVKIGE